jgi:DNA-binding MarR family transcriptional regulator
MDLAAFGPLRQGELAARLQLEKSSVSRLVRQMEVHGWIERYSDRYDGRAVLIRLTRQGRGTASPKISAFPVRRSELPVSSGKFLKNGMISVEFGRFW